MWGDDGIVVRLPEAADALDVEAFVISPDEIDELVVSSLPHALWAGMRLLGLKVKARGYGRLLANG